MEWQLFNIDAQEIVRKIIKHHDRDLIIFVL